jgi:hypothetical protein
MRRGGALLAAIAIVVAAGASASSALPRAPARQRPAHGAAAASSSAFRCAHVVIIDSRAAGEPAGRLSAPVQRFSDALHRELAGVTTISTPIINPYTPAPGFGYVLTHRPRPSDPPGGSSLYARSWDYGTGWVANDGIDVVADRCLRTNTFMIVTGYGEGAQVAGDAAQGDASPNLAAVVLFGDPTFNHEDTRADRGRPRLPAGVNGSLGARRPFTMVHALSYCHRGDPVCQRSVDPRAGFRWHDNYDRLGEPEQAAHIVAGWLHTALSTPSIFTGYGFLVRPGQAVTGGIALTPGETLIFGGWGACLQHGNCNPGEYGHVDWKTWTRTSATGSGLLWTEDCGGDCDSGTWTHAPATASASMPVDEHFTRLAITSGGQTITYDYRPPPDEGWYPETP